jgi:hypothetical protein
MAYEWPCPLGFFQFCHLTRWVQAERSSRDAQMTRFIGLAAKVRFLVMFEAYSEPLGPIGDNVFAQGMNGKRWRGWTRVMVSCKSSRVQNADDGVNKPAICGPRIEYQPGLDGPAQKTLTSQSPFFRGPGNVLGPLSRNLPYPFFPSNPPFSRSQTTSPRRMVHRGHWFSSMPSNGV